MPFYRLVSTSGTPSFELPQGHTLVLGRGLGSDLAIHDPTISRRHAELTAGADGVQVKDLNSSNGTFIGGKRVTAARLRVNDTITFGKVQFQLQRRDSAPGAVAPSATGTGAPVVAPLAKPQIAVAD